jgi:hypothetical protein
MAITNGYTTLAAVRFMLGISNASDTTNDTYIEKIVQAVSRQIDNHCHRRFYANTSDETRYFDAIDYDVCITDDITSITTVKTDEDGDRTYETTWATTDYDTKPINYTLLGEPIMWLEISPNGTKTFPTHNKGVEIVGKFGYCTTGSQPDPISQACIIQSARIFKRTREAPFGVVGSSEMGQSFVITTFDPDVKMLLEPYVRII